MTALLRRLLNACLWPNGLHDEQSLVGSIHSNFSSLTLGLNRLFERQDELFDRAVRAREQPPTMTVLVFAQHEEPDESQHRPSFAYYPHAAVRSVVRNTCMGKTESFQRGELVHEITLLAQQSLKDLQVVALHDPNLVAVISIVRGQDHAHSGVGECSFGWFRDCPAGVQIAVTFQRRRVES